jgi:hypothetical protein
MSSIVNKGVALNASQSRFPGLWSRCVGLWVPSAQRPDLRLIDFSELRNHGVLTAGTQASWQSGPRGYGIAFNGSSQSVTIADRDQYTITAGEPFSLEGWLLFNNTSNAQGVFSKAEISTGAEWLVDISGGNIYWEHYRNDAGAQVSRYSSLSGITGWHHWAFTSLGNFPTGEVNNMVIWLDGKILPSTAAASGTFSLTNTTTVVTVGRFNGTANYLNGAFGSFGIYRRLLEAREISLLASGASPLDKPPTRTIFVPMGEEPGLPDREATLSATLDNATCSATATNAIAATASVTLDAATLSAAATNAVAASASVTLDAATLAATATVATSAAVNVTLDATTLTSTATNAAAATLGVTLDDVTLTATSESGTPDRSAVLNVTLDDATCAGTATSAIAASCSVALDSCVLTAAAVNAITASLDVTLEDAALSAWAVEDRVAVLDVTLEDVVLVATAAGAVVTMPFKPRQDPIRRKRDDMLRGRMRITGHGVKGFG